MNRRFSLLLLALVFAVQTGGARTATPPAESSGAAFSDSQDNDHILFKRWVLSNLSFPADEYDAGQKIFVSVSFCVTKSGQVRGVSLVMTSDEAAARQVVKLVAKSPDWIPAQQQGKPASVELKLILPILLAENADGTLRAEDDSIYRKADTQPRFGDGGPREFAAWIREQILAVDASADSTFQRRILRFVIGKDGSISDVHAVRGKDDRLGKLIEIAARKAPCFSPALLRGEKVRMGAAIPLLFGPENEREAELAASKATTGEEVPLHIAEVMPKFRDGDLGTFRNWVMSRVVYPKEAVAGRIDGRVLVTFVVEKDGSVTALKVLESPHKLLSNEVLRVLRQSPRWSPGIQDGRTVRVRYTLPLTFSFTR